MSPVFAVILLALAEYYFFTVMVGRARSKYGVKAPATTGNADFERVNRVHQNTLESLIIFVPAVWIFGLYVNPVGGAVLGLWFIVGRGLYAYGYYRAADKRALGAALTFIVNAVLVVWGFVVIAKQLV